MENDCTLDQWLTSAAAAMSFAHANWAEFCSFMEDGVISKEVPINRKTMIHHAWHLINLSDPERMPAS